MADKSRIEWTDATWNPVTGCTKVSQGCKHCYAECDWSRMQHLPAYKGRAFTDVGFHPDRLDQPLRWKNPRRIFVNSMSDLFHESVPDEFVDQVFAVMALAKRHTFQVLTKRPERMLRYFGDAETNDRVAWCIDLLELDRLDQGRALVEWDDCVSWPPPNVWLGVSVEDQATADERIPMLLQTPAAVRWISAEPLLSEVDLTRSGAIETDSVGCCTTGTGESFSRGLVDWVVVGGESGPKARPMHPDWARSLRDQCAAASVPFLFKQWGEYASVSEVEGYGKHHRFADGATVRRVGKKVAGRLLDGELHDEYPEREA